MMVLEEACRTTNASEADGPSCGLFTRRRVLPEHRDWGIDDGRASGG